MLGRLDELFFSYDTKQGYELAGFVWFQGWNDKGRELVIHNNFVLNTRFGIDISSFDSTCTGNVISDFSADGIRVTRDGVNVQYNIVKNVYAGPGRGDKNHDDAIQCFLFNKGTGTVKNVTVRSNVIYNHENWGHPLASSFQGIGVFDGPLVNFRSKRT